MPARPASSATGEGLRVRPRPLRAGGRVMTATTSCRVASSAARDGTAGAGVPAKTMRRGSFLPFLDHML